MSALVWQIIYQSGSDKINLNRPLVFMFFLGGGGNQNKQFNSRLLGQVVCRVADTGGSSEPAGECRGTRRRVCSRKVVNIPVRSTFNGWETFFFIFTKTCSISAYSCWTARTVESTLCVRTDSRGRRCSPTPWTGRAAGRAAAAGSRWCSAGWTPSGAPSASRSPSSLDASPPCRPGLGFVG